MFLCLLGKQGPRAESMNVNTSGGGGGLNNEWSHLAGVHAARALGTRQFNIVQSCAVKGVSSQRGPRYHGQICLMRVGHCSREEANSATCSLFK